MTRRQMFVTAILLCVFVICIFPRYALSSSPNITVEYPLKSGSKVPANGFEFRGRVSESADTSQYRYYILDYGPRIFHARREPLVILPDKTWRIYIPPEQMTANARLLLIIASDRRTRARPEYLYRLVYPVEDKTPPVVKIIAPGRYVEVSYGGFPLHVEARDEQTGVRDVVALVRRLHSPIVQVHNEEMRFDDAKGYYVLDVSGGGLPANKLLMTVVKATDEAGNYAYALRLNRLINHAPVAISQTFEMEEDTVRDFPLTASDADAGDTHTFSIQGVMHGDAELSGDQLRYTPNRDFYGMDIVTFMVTDAAGASSLGQHTIHVQPINDPPQLEPIGTIVVQAGANIVRPVLGSDVDSSDLVFLLDASVSFVTLQDDHEGYGLLRINPSLDDAGVYEDFRIVVSDGLLNAERTFRMIVMDAIAPVLTMDHPQQYGIFNTATIKVSGSVDDHEAKVTINDEAVTLSDGRFDQNITLTAGWRRKVVIRAWDIYGNESEEIRFVTIDTVPPVIHWREPQGDVRTNENTVTVAARIRDSFGLSSGRAISRRGRSFLQVQLYVNETLYEETSVRVRYRKVGIPLIEGDNSLRLVATDSAGNSAEEIVHVTLDTMGPVIRVDHPQDGSAFETSELNLSGRVDEDVSFVRVNAEPVTLTGHQFATSLILIEGQNTISIDAEDLLGNMSHKTLTVTLAAEDVPVPVVSAPSDRFLTNQDRVTVSGTSLPEGQVEIVGGVVPVTADTDSEGLFAKDVFLKKNTTNVLQVTTIHSSSRRSDARAVSVIQDSMSPDLMLLSPRDDVTYAEAAITVQGHARDQYGIASISVNGQEQMFSADGEFEFTYTGVEGSNELLIRVTDTAGNRVIVTQDVIVDFSLNDRQAPMIQITAPSQNAFVSSPSLALTGRVEDASPIAEFRINGMLSPLESSGDFHVLLDLVEGNNTILVSATDKNSNHTEITHTITLDTSTPTAAPEILEINPSSPTRAGKVTIFGRFLEGPRVRVDAGLEKVEALVGAQGRFSVNVALASNQESILYVQGFNRAGTVSPIRELRVIQDSRPPAIVRIMPENNATGVSLDTDILLVMNEALNRSDQTSHVFLRNQAGDIIPSEETLSPDGKELRLRPLEPLLGGRRIQIFVSGNLRDIAGNALGQDALYTFHTRQGRVSAPTLKPVPALTNLENLIVQGTSRAGARIQTSGGAFVSEAVVSDTGTFSLSVSLHPNADNTLTVIALDEGQSSDPVILRIRHDSIAPTVSTVPADNATGIDRAARPEFHFSEEMQFAGMPRDITSKSQAAALMIHREGVIVPGQFQILDGGKKMRFRSDQAWAIGARYEMVAQTSLRDLAGNPIAKIHRSTFRIQAAEKPTKPFDISIEPSSPTSQSSVTVIGQGEMGREIRVTGGESSGFSSVDVGGLFEISVDLYPNAVNVLHVIAVNPDGDKSDPVMIEVIHDDRPITVTHLVPALGAVVTANTVITAALSEKPLGFDAASVKLFDENDQEVLTRVTLLAGGTSLSVIPQQPLMAEQNHTIRIAGLKDRAGNISDAFVSSFTIRAAALSENIVVSVDSALPRVTAADTLHISGRAPGADRVVALGGSGSISADVIGETFTLSVPLEKDKVNEITLAAKIAESTVGQGPVLRIAQDSTAPQIHIDSPMEGALVGSRPILVSGRIQDHHPTGEVHVSGKSVKLVGQVLMTQCDLREGPNTVTIVAMDAAGNESRQDIHVTLAAQSVDTMGPVITVTYPKEGAPLFSNRVDLMGTLEDASPIEMITINDNLPSSFIGNVFLAKVILGEEENRVKIRAADTHGQLSEKLWTLTRVSPVTAPVLDPLPDYTDQDIIVAQGDGIPGTRMEIRGAKESVIVPVGEDGRFYAKLALHRESLNILILTGLDAANIPSPSLEHSIVHERARLGIITQSPPDSAKGIASDTPVQVTFDKAIDPATIHAEHFIVKSGTGIIAGGFSVSPAKTLVSFTPDQPWPAGEEIRVHLTEGIRTLRGHALSSERVFQFQTITARSSIAGIIIDPERNPLSGVRVFCVTDPEMSAVTNDLGQFCLKDLTLGAYDIVVDDFQDDRYRYPSIIIPGFAREPGLNILSRPIFMTPINEDATQKVGSGVAAQLGDMATFAMDIPKDSIIFPDGRASGELSVTTIDANHMPTRLPNGGVPPVMVRVDPTGTEFIDPATITFPNVEGLAPGTEVDIFTFEKGIREYRVIGKGVVSADGTSIVGEKLVSGLSYFGVLPSSDLTGSSAYLEGRVVDLSGNGIPGVPVNALASETETLTDEQGRYQMPLPDQRIFAIKVYASAPTVVGQSKDNAEFVVYASPSVNPNKSGATQVPDIVIDSYILKGNIRYINRLGKRVVNENETRYDANGTLSVINEFVARDTDILIYKLKEDGAMTNAPYARGKAVLQFTQPGNNSAYAITVCGLKTHETIRMVAHDPVTGFTGVQDIRLSDHTGELQVTSDVTLLPPDVHLKVTRVFFQDQIRRRQSMQNAGIALVNDQYIEIVTEWRIPGLTDGGHIFNDRENFRLYGSLLISEPSGEKDVRFSIHPGIESQIIELRGIFAQRNTVLNQTSGAAQEWIQIGRQGSFTQADKIPFKIINHAGEILEEVQRMILFIAQILVEDIGQGQTRVSGKALPYQTLTIENPTGGEDSRVRANLDGNFSITIPNIGGEGVRVRLTDVDGRLSRIEQMHHAMIPKIIALSSQQGTVGDEITIRGENFADIPTDNKVRFNGALAPVISAHPAEIITIVPDTATAGPVTVTVAGQTSNGIFYDFIADGIVNPNFIYGDLRGFDYQGDVGLIPGLGKHKPEQGEYFLYLNTHNQPYDGLATVKTQKFFIPAGKRAIVFDMNFFAAGLAGDFQSRVEARLYVHDKPMRQESFQVMTQAHQKLRSGRLSMYEMESGWMTVQQDVTSLSGKRIPVQLEVILHGRPDTRPDHSLLPVDDDNPMNVIKQSGTGLLIEGLALKASVTQPSDVSIETLIIEKIENQAKITAPKGTFQSGEDLIFQNNITGAITKAAVNTDGFLEAFVDIDANKKGHFIANTRSENGVKGNAKSLRIR